MSRLLLLGLIALSLFAQVSTVKWEYLIASDCSPATAKCFVSQGATRNIVLINDLGASGWELVSTIAQGQSLAMIFKRPLATK